ncbi:MAG: Lrp/AsnC family transcriptional regulator [Candidatus Woesearchaeota archaeon]|jgi:Lrp/AsnC family leucine-responsive transcriptional regulator
MGLDTKDCKILYNLDFEARMPLSILAKRVGLSKQVTKYRLDLLQKKGIIQGFYADINSSKLGMAIYLVYLKFHHLTPEKEKEFISSLKMQKSVGVSASLNGKWDYCLGIWAESIVHFKNYYRQIMKEYEKYVQSKTIMIETDFYYFKPKRILDKFENKQITMSGEIENYELDNKDKIILKELSANSRLSLVEIAQKTGLTPNAVKERIKKLEKNKVILGYRIMINYPQLSFLHYRIFLHLENLTEEKERSIIEFLKYQPSVISVTKTIGYCELEFRSVVKDVHEYYQLIEALKKQFPDVIKETESILYYQFNRVLNYYPF